jgi:hypothetical protein
MGYLLYGGFTASAQQPLCIENPWRLGADDIRLSPHRQAPGR